ncbi:MAG: CCA tRNA nucleotidyltransferase [Anaerolineae bacterium]|nr:CCA tRNA nucleotidyltransferase [Anaerolineae bacterium]
MTADDMLKNIDTSLYANRWIAVVHERVVGVGLTAAQAHRAAMQIRAKDKPHLFFVDETGQVNRPSTSPPQIESWLNQHPLLPTVRQILQRHHLEAYLVGGAVRDLLLAREKIIDLDMAGPQNGLTAAKIVANALGAAYYPLDSERGTGRVVYELDTPTGVEKNHLDIATFRGPTLATDLADRDFTINAIALRLSDPPELIDPLQGQHDLRLGIVRAAAETTFVHDPIRILRAVRQASELNFAIEPHTEQLLQAAVTELPTVSPERQRDELLKLLNSPQPGAALHRLHRLAVLPHLLPEVAALVGVTQSPPHHLDVFDHTTKALTVWAGWVQAGFPPLPTELRAGLEMYLAERVAGELTIQTLLPLAILLHDTGKALTRQEEQTTDGSRIRFLGHEQKSAEIAQAVLHRFRLSGQATSFVKTVVAQHMRPLSLAQAGKVSRRAIYRFYRDCQARGTAAGVAVVLHAWVDHLATYPDNEGEAAGQTLQTVVKTLLTAYFSRPAEMIDPPPLLTGHDLITMLNLTEGPLIGMLLDRLKEAQATGQVNNKAQAVAFIEADPDFSQYRDNNA